MNLQPAGDDLRAQPRLISEFAALTPGRTNWLGLTFDIDDDWHIYWDGQGDTGQPVKAKFTLPPGYEVGEILWPAPKRHIVANFTLDYVYERRVTLLVPLKVPADAEAGSPVTIAARVDWMECADACRPGRAEVSIQLPLAPPIPSPEEGADGATVGDSPDATRFIEARRLIPRPVEETAHIIQPSWNRDTLSLVVPGAAALRFYPHRTSATLIDAMTQGESKTDRLTLDFDGASRKRVIGVLDVTRADAQGAKSREYFNVDIPRAAVDADAATNSRPTR